MVNLLQTALYDYLWEERGHLCDERVEPGIPRHAETDSVEFDIKDKEETILFPVGEGVATYKNPCGRDLVVIDYEDFINTLHPALSRKLRRPDFLCYDKENKTFVINELSTGNPRSKRSDAKMQLAGAVHVFNEVYEIKEFIDRFKNKLCVFSCRRPFPETPQGMANAFGANERVLPAKIPLSFQPITKYGFEAWEIDVVEIDEV